MAAPFEELSTLDMVLHEPARLAILSALSACRACDFVYLQSLIGLTGGNLSTHLQKLEEHELIDVEKRFKGRRPQTLIRLTPKGRAGIERHWRKLEALRNAARDWRPEPRPAGID
jgi:DNA-binding MarR family transcriptional regulator